MLAELGAAEARSAECADEGGPTRCGLGIVVCSPIRLGVDGVGMVPCCQQEALSCLPLHSAGLQASVFMHPQHLHLTIAMLKLYRRVSASSLLPQQM